MRILEKANNNEIESQAPLIISSEAKADTLTVSLNKPSTTKTYHPRLFVDLHKDILVSGIGQFLSLSEKDLLSRVGNKTLYTFFYPSRKQATEQLLLHIVYGEKEEAAAMLERNPKLLLNKATVTDGSGRKINGTAWQVAAGADDVSINFHSAQTDDESKKSGEMLEMIEDYFKLLPNYQLILAQQRTEQFPEGYEEIEKERSRQNLEIVKRVIEMIAMSSTDEECEAVLQEFSKQLQPKGVITTGKHFDVNLLPHVIKLYDENYERFGGMDSRKNNLFWIRIIGEIEFHLPASYAQALNGLDKIMNQKMSVDRKLSVFDYMRSCHIPYYTRTNELGLGVNLALEKLRRRHMGIGRNKRACSGCPDCFKNYIDQKQARLAVRLNVNNKHKAKNTKSPF